MNEAIDPRLLAKEGSSTFHKGQYIDSAKAFQAARQGFETAGDWLSAAEMANNCSVAYLKAEQAGNAMQELEGIEELFAQAGDHCRQGMTVGNQAAALEALGRFDEALLAYQRSAEILGIAGDDQLRATVLQSLSALQLRTGKQLQALVSMQQGIEGLKKPSPIQKMLKKMLVIPFDLVNKKR